MASASISAELITTCFVITAGTDHIAPRDGTLPLLEHVSSQDVMHFDRPGGHIGLVAGSKAKRGALA